MAHDGISPRDSVREAVLITEARTSVEEQHRARVRKYLFIMSFRIPALVLAALSYGAWQNPWIAMAIVGVSIPLPWMAVLIANDRPPRTADEPSRYGWRATDSTALEARSHPVVNLDEEPDLDRRAISNPRATS
ncbi:MULTISPECIES: DUF3099 domain-containing protein [Nocardiaceae]|jgi:hypothetical protein|uniref:DUF3099 domain-containing protein n=1 Tax=Rhodococcoides corynebacterioides TaxID=53972 RepID=A0ABS2KSA9_9NOCA|nr:MULTISPECIES: DUF3099 domain-containing protein [Rhodococcus]KQU34701.1 hypothetical protein ASG69_01785 [Rhodococcus sp. Leaf225]KQU45463.1 hypothetical protein ASH03_09335 [Rhodococcus sp. Leaf258]MBM7414799.1 hypothetical protein [Rhodococcus corynebacterioides]MBP1117261.1 hypothetical protein [Rhodococcus sp. PvP016]MBY6675654.1 DUF3099 domain-containing protein [Rhodococcus sp. BP-332]